MCKVTAVTPVDRARQPRDGQQDTCRAGEHTVARATTRLRAGQERARMWGHRHSRRTTHMRTHQLQLPVHMHVPTAQVHVAQLTRPGEDGERFSSSTTACHTRHGQSEGQSKPMHSGRGSLVVGGLARTCLPGGGPHLIVRDKERHLPDLARTQDRDSPEGEPMLPRMGRVRSAAGERNGPRGDAQGQQSACSHGFAKRLSE